MAVNAYLDGVDVTSITQEGSCTHQLVVGSTASIKVSSDQTSADEDSKLRITLNGALDFHGAVEHVSDDADEDEQYTIFTAADPTVALWPRRPVRDSTGDFSKPNIIDTFNTGPQIFQQALQNSETFEGDLFIELGSFATGGVNISGFPTDWPMTLEDLVALLTGTGEVDIIVTAIDSGGNLARVDVYNGNYGQNLSGSVRFEYQTGLGNARRVKRTIDKNDLCNKLWYYGGPRVKTHADPAGDQHWAFNVTADDTGLADPPQSTIESQIASSRTSHGVRMDIKIFDGDSAVAARELYRRTWQAEAWLRSRPRTRVEITPDRGIHPAFGVGDLIHVASGPKVRGGFSGTQRVYEYTYRWDKNGTIELGESVGQAGAAAVVVSGDNEGLP